MLGYNLQNGRYKKRIFTRFTQPKGRSVVLLPNVCDLVPSQKSLDRIIYLEKAAFCPTLFVRIGSVNLILAGPPGSGKTTLASVIAAEGKCKLLKVNAVTSNAAELRDTLKLVRYYGSANCFLFVDELHRFNKAQQDLLLPDVESGDVRLIGATTHNPRYYIIDPLLSRCQLLSLEPIPSPIIENALQSALQDDDRGWVRDHALRVRKLSNKLPYSQRVI